MFRGTRPHRDGYRHPPPSRGFGPRPGPGHFRDRGPHSPPDPYRRSSPRRRYSPPHHSDEYRGARPLPKGYGRYSSSPPHPNDHGLVITVGNEMSRPSGYPGTEAPYIRDYGAGESHYHKPPYCPRRPSYDASRRRSVSPGMSRARSRSPGYGRSRSRPRSKSRSRPRSKSRSRSKSRGRSRGRSKSRQRGKSYSRSRSRSGSRGRSRAKSKGRSQSRGRSRGKSQNRGRSRERSCSGSSNSSSSSSRSSRSQHRKNKEEEDFRELEKARRHKEIQDMLARPAKSILKKRMDSSEIDSPMLMQKSDSPPHSTGGLSQAEEVLAALSKTMDPGLLSSMLGKGSDVNILEELIAKIQGSKEGGNDLFLPQQKSDLTELLGMFTEVAQPQNIKRRHPDIEDEEKFLYGDEENETGCINQSKETVKDSSHPNAEHDTSPYIFTRTIENAPSCSAATPELNAQEEPAEFPPGVGPEDVSARKEVEEYEKIQDLLKTVGLDLNVAEISKMAARTQARIHGNTPARKTLLQRQSDRKRQSRSRSCSSSSSNSSNSSRSSSRSSSQNSSLEPSPTYSKKKAASSEKEAHTQSKKEAQAVISETTWPSAPTTTPEAYPPRPGFSAHPRSSLLGPPPQGVLPPPDFQAHSYSYGNYIPYMPSGWPMYPQTAMQVPPPNIPDPYMPPKMERPLLRTIKNDNKNATSKLDAMTSKMMSSSSHSKEMEDKNTASQKQKVTEELEKLRKENEMRHKRKQNLLKDVETLRRQQGELLRKKRREKDGHKDPFLLELSQLQEDAMTQISKLRAEQNEADEKHDELMKVALILGINPKDSKDYGAQSQSKELAKGFERSGDKTSSSYTKMSSKSRASPEKLQTPPQSSSQSLDTAVEQFEYYDAGNHWCKNCNVTSGSMFDYFMHLHSKSHRKTLDPYDRPWAKSECEKKLPAGKRTSKPAKGSEFLIPVRGFFCLLCQQFFGDPICAEAHVTCHDHNDQYQSKMYENPLYEQRRNLDRQVGMENQKSLELKRRYDNEDQVDVKKFKHSEVEKQHCIKEDNRNIKTFDRQYKQKYKEDSEKPKYKEDEEYSYRYKEGERSRYEEDGYRNRNEHFYRHKEVDDRNRYRQDKDRGRYSRDEGRNDKDEDKGFKNSRDLEEKAKHKGDNWGKWQKSKLDENQMKKEYNSQYQRGKTDILPDEKESAGKSLAEKPSEPPKVLCGPSPAMLAKLRKKNEDVTGRPAVGKFIRKKPQKSVLEKEAERMAAQFLKEEEEQKLVNDELDPFARSIAAAKSIAIKLTGQPVVPPSGAWVAYNEDKTNPSVPSPFSPVVIRKAFTTVQHKQNPPTASTANQKSPASSANLVSKACSGEEVQIKETKSTSPVDVVKTPVSKENTTTPLTPTQHPTLSTAPQTVQTTTVKTVMPAPVPAPPAKKEELKTPLVKQMEPAPNKAMKTQVKPGAPMEQVFTLQPDVAAPGVPVEEQKQTVVLRPPPQMFSNARGAASIIGKPKTLAAGRAKDLFSIFYSGNSAMNTAVGNGKDFGFAPVGGKIYKDTNNEDKNISGATPRKPTANDDYCKENKESVTKVELPKSEDSTKDQSKEISQNDGSDSLVMVQSCMNKVTQVACNETDVVQIKVSSKTEGFEVNSGIIEGAEVAQNTQPLDKDVASEECTKSQDLQVTQTWDSPINKNLEDENSKASPKNKESKVAENDESLKSNELQNIPYGDSTITQDLEAENKEAMSYENFKVQSESSENADLQHAQSKNSPIHKCSETEASKDCLNNKESKTVQSNESPKRVSEDSPVNKFSEDSKETPKTVKLQDDDSEVAQSENALNEDDKDEILAAKESPKNEGVMVVLINDSPLNDDSEDQSTKNENLCVEPVFENTTIENENNESNEKVFEDLQVLKPIEIEMEEVGNVDTLIQTSTEEENPLDSEEPMTFSPLPGSFTEQLNLDTFDFSFEPL